MRSTGVTPDFYDRASVDPRTRTRIRHLPWVPARCVSLCNAFPTLFDLIDEGKTGENRRCRQGRLRQGRGPVLFVRRLLHDQVPVRSAAPVERGLPALDAACQGAKSSKRGEDHLSRSAAVEHRPPGQNSRRFRWSCRWSTRRTRRRSHAVRWTAVLGVHRDRRLPPYARQNDSTSSLRAPSPGRSRDGQRTPGKGRDLLNLLRELQRARVLAWTCYAFLDHNEIPYTIVENEVLLRDAKARAR